MNPLNAVGWYLLGSAFIYSFFMEYREKIDGEKKFIFHGKDVLMSLAITLFISLVLYLITYGY